MVVRQDDPTNRRQGYWGLALVLSLLILVLALWSLGIWPARPGLLEAEELPIQFDIRRIREQDPGYVVQLRVQNRGPERMLNLHVEGQLYSGTKRLERSVGQLEMMPSGAVRQVRLFFLNDPRQHQLRLLARGDAAPMVSTSEALVPAGLLSLL